MKYIIIVQPADGSPDHWLNHPNAKQADAFARWIHKTTGAAVAVIDARNRERLVLGDFDRSRT